MAIFADYAFGLKESYSAQPAYLDNLHEYASENADYRAFKESYADMVSIVESIVEYDLKSLQLTKEAMETGQDEDSLYAVYEGAFTDKVKEIFGKIKDYLQKLWTKIKQVVKTITAKILSIFMSGKKFVAKYSAELNKVKGKKVKIKGYEFQNLISTKLEDASAYTKPFEGLMKKVKDEVKNMEHGERGYISGATELKYDKAYGWKGALEDLNEKKDDLYDILRGLFVGKSQCSSDDYAEELFDFYRKNSGYVEEQEIKVSDAMEFLKKDYTSIAKKNESIIDKAFTEAIKEVDNAAKMAERLPSEDKEIKRKEKIDAYIAYSREVSSVLSGATSIRQQAFKAWVAAIKQAESMYKTVCVKAIGGKVED